MIQMDLKYRKSAEEYGVHYCSKHFEHIFDFLTPFSRPGGQIPQSRITS